MGERRIMDMFLLLLMTTSCAFCGTFLEENVTQNYENYSDDLQMEVLSTLPPAKIGNNSNSSSPRNDRSRNNYDGTVPGDGDYSSTDVSGWSALEDYWSTILNNLNLPDGNKTKAFILKYPSDLQRKILVTQLGYCPLVPLCSYSMNASGASSLCCESCNCHQNCKEYNNCCPDMINVQDVLADQRANSCIPLYLNINLRHEDYSVNAYAIADCPTTSMDMDRENCGKNYHNGSVTMTDILPVWHNGSGVVYRNIHCALCNGVHLHELDFFIAEISCYSSGPTAIQTESELIEYVFLSNDCNIAFRAEDRYFELEYCQDLDTISRCNITGRWTRYNPEYELACRLYTSVVEWNDGMRFKNVFCAFCNGYTDVQEICTTARELLSEPFSFSGLLTIADADDVDKSAADIKCSSGFVYHKTADTCIQASCSSLRRLVGNQCVAITNGVGVFNYEAVLRLTPSVTHLIAESFDLVEDVLIELKRFIGNVIVGDPSYLFICSADIILKSNTSCTRLGTIDILQQNLLYYLLRLNFRIESYHQPDDIVSKLSDKIHLHISNIAAAENFTINLNIMNGYVSVFNSPRLYIQRESDVNGTSSEDGPELAEFCSSFDDRILVPYFSPLSVDNVSLPLSVVDYCNYYRTYKPALSLLTCPMVKVSRDSNPWIVNDNGVLFMQSGHMFNHTQFYLSGENESVLLLCIDNYFELTTETDARPLTLSVEHVISITCVSLSIVSLLVTLAAFSLLAPLRSLPGKNNMALVSAMLVAHALYLIGSFSGFEQDAVACKLVGILTHFFWLLVVFWMNVCTFHMFHVLTKTQVMPHRKGNKRYFAYHVYCVISSAVLVGINVLISSLTSGQFDIGYGLYSCYFSSQKMLMYTFGLPLALVVVSNIGLFLIVVVTVKTTSAVQKNIKHERNDIAVLARLSTLTGATWITGFIYTWTRLSVFSYIFIILNAGQGVLLFLSFICTRRVITIARQKYSRSSPTATSSMRHSTDGRI